MAGISLLGSSSHVTPATRCDGCQTNVEKVKKCGRCLVASYCSEKCQKSAWPKHRETCVVPSERKEKTLEKTKEWEALHDSALIEPLVEIMKSIVPGSERVLSLTRESKARSKAQEKITQLIKNSFDKELLSQYSLRTFPREQYRKMFKSKWTKQLSPEEYTLRFQEFEQLTHKIDQLQKLAYLGVHSLPQLFVTLKACASVRTTLPEDSENSEIRKSGLIQLEILPLIEASADADLILLYSFMEVSRDVLAADLKDRWAQLPPIEAQKREQAWQAIAPKYKDYLLANSSLTRSLTHLTNR